MRREKQNKSAQAFKIAKKKTQRAKFLIPMEKETTGK